MKSAEIKGVRIIDFPKILDNRGNLSFFQNSEQIPFDIMRAYWIYDVPGGEIRGSHAFRTTQEVIVALSGSFDVVLNDGLNESRFHMNRSYYGLFVPVLVWRTLENFSTNSLALVVCDREYDETDYLRSYDEFGSARG